MIDIVEIYKVLRKYCEHDNRTPVVDYIKPLANTFIVGFRALYNDNDKREFYFVAVFSDSQHMSQCIACGQV